MCCYMTGEMIPESRRFMKYKCRNCGEDYESVYELSQSDGCTVCGNNEFDAIVEVSNGS